MKRSQISVPWQEGLHLRPAATLVKRAMDYRSEIRLRFCGKMADARSIFAVVLLSATCGSVIELEVSGVDEDDAHEAISAVFGPDDRGPAGGAA